MTIRTSLFALLGLTLTTGCATGSLSGESPGDVGSTGQDDGSAENDGDIHSEARTARVQGRILQEVHGSLSGQGYFQSSFSTATHFEILVRNESGEWETWEGSSEEGSEGIEEDGSFETEVPADEEACILQVLDADGNIVGMTILESTGEEGSETWIGNIDIESWVESMVYLEATSEGHTGADGAFLNVISLSSWIDARISQQVFADFEDDGEASETMSDLTAAIEAALATELAAWSERGFDFSAESLFDLMLEASEACGSCGSEGESSAQATFDLLASFESAFEAEGADSEDMQSVWSMTSLAFRLTSSSLFEGDGSHGEAMIDAAWSQASRIEGFFAISRVEEIMVSYGDEGEQALAAEIMSELWASLSASGSDESSMEAWEAYCSALLEGEGSLLEDGLDFGSLDGFLSSLIEGSVEGSYDEAASFDASITSQIEAIVKGSGESMDAADCAGISSLVVESFSSLQSSLTATCEETGEEMSSTQASFMTELVVATMTSFRGEG